MSRLNQQTDDHKQTMCFIIRPLGVYCLHVFTVVGDRNRVFWNEFVLGSKQITAPFPPSKFVQNKKM